MDEQRSRVELKRGREKPVRNRHPWIFSGAIARVLGEAADGELVRVVGHDGAFLAMGDYSARSQIRVRLVSWDQAEEPEGTAFWRGRLERALAHRAGLEADPRTDAYRLVNAEADGLPGLFVDRYADWLVVQALSQGMARRQEMLVGLLVQLVGPRGIYARDDASVRRKEGLRLESRPLWGEEPPDRVEILEHGHRFLVDVRKGHKTGFYLDQRENRRRVAAHCAGARVLNAFAYTGAFGVYAAAAGARSVLSVDSSLESLVLAEEHVGLNGLEPQEMVAGDAFQVLRHLREQGQAYDVVILDPPKFATSQANVMEASRGYKDINLLAMQLLRPGGLLATFSCSGHVSADLFQKIVFGASVDAGREVLVLEPLAQGPDHPVLLTFPESAYLKGFLCRVW